ncbi:MAG: hydroxyacylglutathione hydrolase [Burkholderiaceae bacterium]|nr:hydroxyacylglutathione hydrolase [Burkholderiaceae bacterium]
MNLIALPAFADNYIWLLHDGTDAVVIDPGDSAPVLAALDRLKLRLASILVTHHHDDHVGGVKGLRPLLQGPVYGPAFENIPEPCLRVRGGKTIRVLGLDFDVIDVPGHTSGHIAYFHQSKPRPDTPTEAPLLFCGDTLFSGGCGRLFEGTPEQMHHSLSALAKLPGDTRVCCAHEYTLANLKFAHAIEPDNDALDRYTRWCEQQRAAGLPTLPGRIAEERAVNPFLRCDVPAVIDAALNHGARSDQPVDVFAALRLWKNEFR